MSSLSKRNNKTSNRFRSQGSSEYRSFSKINGQHPLQEVVPEMCVLYSARKRHGAEVNYFNFDLAREMGLISSSHPNELTHELSKAIIECFSIVIINEYDIENKISFPEDEIKPHKYMATRYLQLQHPNKTGKTSGDGRSIWNGYFSHKGKTWDISSCGTGATCLSPAAAIHGRNFQTGDASISYGCGLADYDDALSATLMSEIFHKNHYPTERTLAVLKFKDGTSINVRAHSNLLRPAHFFRYLKLGDHHNLKALCDYHIQRETNNSAMAFDKKSSNLSQELLKTFTHDFARSSALFEREYIFCWLDWDGDNILMSDAAILDYGSVRQFGLFHKDYRYDDVERWSTTILEQKSKAKYLVQTCAQMIDYVNTKEKKNVAQFANDPMLSEFEKHFHYYKMKFLLKNIGFSESSQEFLLKKHSKKVQHFQKLFEHFERVQSQKGVYKVDDGITSDAVFCMRDILRELPRLFLAKNELINNSTFIEIIKSSYAKEEDLTITPSRSRKIRNFQNSYMSLIKLAAQGQKCTHNRMLLEITMRSSQINRSDRITGNGIIRVASAISKIKPQDKGTLQILPDFIKYQVEAPPVSRRSHKELKGPLTNSHLRKLALIVQQSREEI